MTSYAARHKPGKWVIVVNPIWGQSWAWSPSWSDTYDLNQAGIMQIGGGAKEGHRRSIKGISYGMVGPSQAPMGGYHLDMRSHMHLRS